MLVMTSVSTKVIIAQRYARAGSVPVSALGEVHQPKLWAGLQSLVMVVRVRRLRNKTTRDVQFYVCKWLHLHDKYKTRGDCHCIMIDYR